MDVPAQGERERAESERFALPLPLGSIQALNRLEDTHPLGEIRFLYPTTLIQMLTSSTDIPKDTQK